MKMEMEIEVMSPDGSGGSATPSPPLAPMLPPCRVCGEKASGFHYGANTCEACKGFFRRSLQRKEVYRCIGDGSCRIGIGKRNVCAYCRYQKCLTVGMSKTAIKTGRYTHEKKTRDIEEVKRLQHQQKLKLEGKPVPLLLEPILSPNSLATPCSITNLQRSHSPGMVSSPSSVILPSPGGPASPSPSLSALLRTRDEELEEIVAHITQVHIQQTPHTPDFFCKLPEKEKQFLERRALQTQMFGPMKPIPRDEYMHIYQSTGIDVDGRREMIQHLVPCIEKAIKRFIAFAKALPGFKDLPIDDQIALIKGSRFDAWMMSAYKAFNGEHRLFTHVCGFTLHIEELSKLHDLDFLEFSFRVANRMKCLNLTTQEECVVKAIAMLSGAARPSVWVLLSHRAFNYEQQLFTPLHGRTISAEELSTMHGEEYLQMLFAMVGKIQKLGLLTPEVLVLAGLNIMSTDWCELRNTAPIESNQHLLVDTLLFLFKRNHPNEPYLFPRAVAVLTELRTFTLLNVRQEEKFAVDWTDKVEFPQLLYEMWST